MNKQPHVTLEEMLEYCRKNPNAKYMEFPFFKDDGTYGRLKVFNPFYVEVET